MEARASRRKSALWLVSGIANFNVHGGAAAANAGEAEGSALTLTFSPEQKGLTKPGFPPPSLEHCNYPRHSRNPRFRCAGQYLGRAEVASLRKTRSEKKSADLQKPKLLRA